MADVLTQIKSAMSEASKPGMGALKRLDQLEEILESWMKNTNRSLEHIQNQVDFLMPKKEKEATYKMPDEEFITAFLSPYIKKLSRSNRKRDEYSQMLTKVVKDLILEYNRDLSVEDFPEVSIGKKVKFTVTTGSSLTGLVVGSRKYAFELNVGEKQTKILRTKYIKEYEVIT